LLANAARAAGPPLLFGLRLWASVCLALYVAFWLELDNAYWAGTSAALVCQPHLGASLRKGWYRIIGTLVGAVLIVVLTGVFPQNRFGFLVGLALLGAEPAPWLPRSCTTSPPTRLRWPALRLPSSPATSSVRPAAPMARRSCSPYIV
jgi:hypothetical protein